MVTRVVRKMKDEELDANLTDVLSFSMEQITDRLINGNLVLDKDGNERRIPISARDLTTNFAILFDKRTILRADPTSKQSNSDVTDHLQSVADKLERLVGKIPSPEVIDGEFKEISDGQELQERIRELPGN